MRIYPAIDIQGGRCVRLLQGRAQDATVYGGDPAQMAKRWVKDGAEYLHVVDLDGAFSGQGKNGQAVRGICVAAGDVPVQLGGGIRSMADIEERFSWGVTRVILGTAAISNPALVREAAQKYPGKIVAGIDARDGRVAVQGWVSLTDADPIELGQKLRECGVPTCVYTDISKDGMLSGPNVEATCLLAQTTGLDVIASGGISSLADIQKLADSGIGGAIIGKALYDRQFSLAQAIKAGKRTEGAQE